MSGEGHDADGIAFDDDFVRGGVYEPPARTRAAIARYGSQQTSWRQAGPTRPGRIEDGARQLRSSPSGIPRPGRARSRHNTEKVSPVFVGLIGLTVVIGALVWQGSLGRPGIFCLALSGWVVTLCLHEYGHALAGFHGGDDSVATKGYLRLDPRRYQHPILSFVIPVLAFVSGGIGFPGGAVWIDRSAIRSRGWRSATSFAGPAVNVACAALCLAPFALLPARSPTIYQHANFFLALALLGALQLSAIVLNLLPIPGLDGWGVVEPFLAEDVAVSAQRFATPAVFVVMLVLLSLKPIGRAIWYLPLHVGYAAGVPRGFVEAAWALAQFWNH